MNAAGPVHLSIFGTHPDFRVLPRPTPDRRTPRNPAARSWSPAELEPLLRRATAAGLDVAVHAIGDRANGLVLDAFAATDATGRIEHAQLLSDHDVARFAALGVAASVQPEHAVDDRDVADRHWAGRTHRAFAYRSLLDAGAELVLGSDAPVAPLDPWITLAAAVHRSEDGRPRWHPEQEIPVAVALAASAGPDGPVAVGRRADLTITGLDPASAPATARPPCRSPARWSAAAGPTGPGSAGLDLTQAVSLGSPSSSAIEESACASSRSAT